MKALRFHRANDLRVEDVPRPRPGDQREINGLTAEARLAARAERSRPLVAGL